MLIRTDTVPEGAFVLDGPVIIHAVFAALLEHKNVVVTRDSLVLPTNYPLMESNRNKAWADVLFDLTVFCKRNSVTLYLMGPCPDGKLWDWFTRTTPGGS